MKLLFWIHISSINKKGKAPISMRITIDGLRAELKTDISIEPALWDKEQQCILGPGELTKQYNDRIIGLTSQAWSFYNQGLVVKEKITAHKIKDFILNRNQPKQGLLEAFEYHIANLRLRVGLDVAPRTVNNYLSVKG